MFEHEFKNKVVVVTGGSGVLCSYFCKELARRGAKVCILSLDEKRLADLEAEIRSDGGEATSFLCNVLDKEVVKKVHKQILDKYGKVDILINGAGGNNPKATTNDEFYDLANADLPNKKDFFDLDLDGINFVFGLNFSGTLIPTQEFAPDMVGREGTTILNISSMNAFTPLTKIPAYSAAKAAVSNFTKWLATYFSKVGIRVNAIAPGFFSTAQNKALLWNEDGSPTARTKKILNNTPMGRFGEPEELVGAVLWLLDSKASSFVTGVVLPIDGGFSAYSGV